MNGAQATTDPKVFKKILQQNVTLPLVICGLLCVIFVGLVVNLIKNNSWVDHTNVVITKANETFKFIVDSESGYRGYLVTNNEVFLDPYNLALPRVESNMDQLRKLVQDNPAQLRQLEVVNSFFNQWKNYVQEAVSDREQILKDVKNGHNLRKDIMDSIRREINRFIDTERILRDNRSSTTETRSQVLVLMTVIFSLAAGIFLAFNGRKQLMNLSETFEGTLKKQYEQNQELTEQAWLRSGQADLAARVRGELTLSEIGAAALEFFSSYIQPALGALFVSDDKKLQRVSTLAFSDSASPAAQKVYALGEGLVGEAAKKQKVLRLNNVPADYFQISSGLGKSAPKEIVLVPLKADGYIQGVVELGFMEPISLSTLKFLEQSSENLGAAIKSALYRTRLQELLEETQAQSEELQTQQEELKVSNEELMERSQALIDAQARLEGQHAELEQSNEKLEQQRQALDHQNRILRESQIEVERKSRDIQEANQYKSEFLANMSHELRTPLNSTLILSKLLKDNPKGNLSEEQVEFAETIYSAGNDLLALINDILDLSKVEAGKLDIYNDTFSIDKLLKGLKNIFQPLVKTKNLELFIESDLTQDILHTDRQRLEQILKNLISNAIKFTSKGSVTIRVTSPRAQELAFSIIDTGIGISQDKVEYIFEAFRQADGTTNRKYGGTGLGLTISRNLAKLLGGTLSVQSSQGSGSTFTLTMPVTPDTKVQSEPPVSRPSIQAKVMEQTPTDPPKTLPYIEDDSAKLPNTERKVLLIVEDEVVFAKVLMSMAREQKFLCLVAQTTEQGFELAKEHRPDAILLDMKLPDGSGLSLLDKLKENARTRHIPVHVISSADYAREALHLGAIGYLMKPADPESIKKTLGKLEEKIDQRMKKVLVVEDDEVQRKAISKLIEDKGVTITTVGTGKEALELLTQTQFDCVILDLTLPDISGFDLLENLAAHKDGAYPPVIVYTGKPLTQKEEEKLRRYSETIIIKGARSPERLLDEVALFLHQVESQLSDEKQNMLKSNRNPEKSFEGRRILLVDDDARNIFALMSILEHKGADVVVARNGLESLEKLKETEGIDLVLMDIMMPEMDGYTAIKSIRNDLMLTKLPIIAVTAKAMRDDYEKCLEAGANDYLSKPVDVEKLVSLMRVWLPRH